MNTMAISQAKSRQPCGGSGKVKRMSRPPNTSLAANQFVTMDFQLSSSSTHAGISSTARPILLSSKSRLP